jgi:hypothetical protein
MLWYLRDLQEEGKGSVGGSNVFGLLQGSALDLAVLRRKLEEGKGSVRSKMWDARRMASSIEQAYYTMRLLWQAQTPPQQFVVTE